MIGYTIDRPDGRGFIHVDIEKNTWNQIVQEHSDNIFISSRHNGGDVSIEGFVTNEENLTYDVELEIVENYK